jgi:hypothetical protein
MAKPGSLQGSENYAVEHENYVQDALHPSKNLSRPNKKRPKSIRFGAHAKQACLISLSHKNPENQMVFGARTEELHLAEAVPQPACTIQTFCRTG